MGHRAQNSVSLHIYNIATLAGCCASALCPLYGLPSRSKATCPASEKPAICFYSMLRCPCRCPCGIMHAVQWCAHYKDIQTHVCTRAHTTLHALVHRSECKSLGICSLDASRHVGARVQRTCCAPKSWARPVSALCLKHSWARKSLQDVVSSLCTMEQDSGPSQQRNAQRHRSANSTCPSAQELRTFSALCATPNYILRHVLGPTCIRVCAVFARRSRS